MSGTKQRVATDKAAEATAGKMVSGIREEEGQTMTDVAMKRPLRVSTDGTAGTYIMVSVSRLDDVRRLLDDHDIGYWVEEDAISLNGAPEVAVVNLGRGADAAAVQAILDCVR